MQLNRIVGLGIAAVVAAALATTTVVWARSSDHPAAHVPTMMGGGALGRTGPLGPYGSLGPMMSGSPMMGGYSGSGSAGPSGAAVPGARVVTVTARDFSFSPSVIHVRAGETVMIALTSADIPHDFTIDALGVHVVANGGQTVSGALHAPATPGQYTFYCSVPGYRQAGMSGTLVIDPAS